jgi:hypothetical protein
MYGDDYVLNICEMDKIYMVCRKSTGSDHVYRTVAECTSREVAEILYAVLTKKEANHVRR